ncbi:MAG: hypothetical protein ACTSPV_00775 [Candidatus Hodarchaeales archaeon]
MLFDSKEQKNLLINILNSVELKVTANMLLDIYEGKKDPVIDLLIAIKNGEIKDREKNNA